MGCAGTADAMRGERDVTFANERTYGDAALDRIAAVSKAIQTKRAEVKMKKQRAVWMKQHADENTFQEQEEEAGGADWWTGESGNVVKQLRDDTPFEISKDEIDEEDDYDTYYDDYDAFNDYDYDGYGNGNDNIKDMQFAGDSVSLPPPQFSGEPQRASASPDEGGSNKAGNVRKAEPKRKSKSAAKNDPWPDSDDSDTAPQPKPKGRPKAKARTSVQSADSDDQRRKDQAAVKIQAAQRGRKVRGEVEAARVARPKPKARGQPKRRTHSKQLKDEPLSRPRNETAPLPKHDPWADDSDSSGKGPNGRPPPKPRARRMSNSKIQKDQKASLLANRRDTQDSDISNVDVVSSKIPSRTKARPKPRSAKPPAGQRGTRPGGNNKSSAPSDSSEDGGKVMF